MDATAFCSNHVWKRWFWPQKLSINAPLEDPADYLINPCRFVIKGLMCVCMYFIPLQSVHKCDFLNLQIQQPLQVAPDTVNRYLRTLKSPVETLPRECFHVIVFSLLLSYFPSPYQRWICCQKAHQLLQMNGLLLIITPDSSHQNRNQGMVKSWRTAIESLGFTRWRYIKDTHLHYMAFRKTSMEPCDMSSGEVGPDMLYIPQDFNEDLEESVFSDCLPQSEADIAELSDAFRELPTHFVDDISDFW